MQVINGGCDIIALNRSERTRFNQRVLAMPAKVGPKYGVVCCLVKLYREVEKPRAISAVSMQKNHGRRAFGAKNLPTPSLCSVMIGPGDVARFQDWSYNECVGSHQVRSAWRPHDATAD